MIIAIRHTSGLGNAAVYARLRNASGQFWDFVALTWGVIGANCKQFLTEYADSDPATAHYSKAVTTPVDAIYSIEVVLESTSAVLGVGATEIDVADVISIKAKTDNLPTDPADQSLIIAATDAVIVAIADVPTVSEFTARTLPSADYTVITDLPVAPTAAQNADAVWDELSADHLAAGSEGSRLASIAPAAIADAVWDEATIGHVAVGSAGEALRATITALYPSAVTIAAALWAKIVTGAVSAETALATLYNGWSASVGPGSGAGAIVSTITVNVGGAPADGVEVWISTDEAGANVIAGTLVTGAFGQATFMLDQGTYFLWKQKSGATFTNPETIVVV